MGANNLPGSLAYNPPKGMTIVDMAVYAANLVIRVYCMQQEFQVPKWRTFPEPLIMFGHFLGEGVGFPVNIALDPNNPWKNEGY